MISSPVAIFIDKIETQYRKKNDRNIWENSQWSHISDLENDDVGKVGESTIHDMCIKAGILASIDGAKTKKNECGDGMINGHSVEIKTARLGSSGQSFQHELGETPWVADYMIFFDIAPTKLYITVFRNFSKEFYERSGVDSTVKCIPYFPTKSITWRKKKGAFKLDTTIKINNDNKYTFVIDQMDINLGLFKTFINTAIVPIS
jgi:hypothetical protein